MSAHGERFSDLTSERAVEVLRWWIEAGSEAPLDETPRDRFADSAEIAARRAVAPLPAATRSGPPPSQARRNDTEFRPPPAAAAATPARASSSAAAVAAAARTLADLRETLESFDGCGLKATATQLVFADGAAGAEIMLVGEAPGADEDRIGRPFVGRAGQLLDRMLGSIGLDRTRVYIANCVPWRPPGNRTPTPQETQICLPFIRRQIELANPRLLVLLGGSALSTLLGGSESISRARGSWRAYPFGDGRTIPAFPMFHPAYLLRQPSAKRRAWSDLRKLRLSVAAGYRPL